jgi:serine/threonine protein kinase
MKPANILISGGAVKIADFGFAKENIHRKVKNESSVGTPMYMSVEVLKGKTYTSKCDIWAIGVIFYEMLHGKTPWKAKS